MQQNAVHLAPKRKAFSTKTQCEMHHLAPLKAIKCHEKSKMSEKKSDKTEKQTIKQGATNDNWHKPQKQLATLRKNAYKRH